MGKLMQNELIWKYSFSLVCCKRWQDILRWHGRKIGLPETKPEGTSWKELCKDAFRYGTAWNPPLVWLGPLLVISLKFSICLFQLQSHSFLPSISLWCACLSQQQNIAYDAVQSSTTQCDSDQTSNKVDGVCCTVRVFSQLLLSESSHLTTLQSIQDETI